MKEIWKDIEGYKGLYQVSNQGRVKSLIFKNNICEFKRDKILKLSDNGKGYLIIGLFKNKHRKNFYIHRLVAEHFILNEKKLPEVNHKDLDKANNIVENLEWVSKKENAKHYHNTDFAKEKYKQISRTLKENYQKKMDNKAEYIIERYTKYDETIEEINKITGMGCNKISEILRINNIKLRTKPRDKYKFKRDKLGRFLNVEMIQKIT